MKKRKKCKKFKMPTSFTTIIILTIAVAVLTFIIPAGQYEYKEGMPVAGTYQVVTSNPQGLWDILKAPIEGFRGAIDIILFVLVLGGCLGVLFETKAIDAALSKVVVKSKGREKMLIPIVMGICAIGGTTYGMAEETIAFYPILIPVLLTAGYDVVTGIMVEFLGAGVGIVGGISNPFSVGIGSNIAGISLGDGILTRLVLFIACFIFAVFFVMRYAEKVRKDPTKSIVYDIRDITNAPFEKNNTNEIIEFTPKRKKVITIFGCMFLLMIIAIIPWGSKFGVHIFEDFHEFLTGIPILGSILGHSIPLGDWFFTEMTMLFLAGAVLIGIVYGFNEKKIVDLFIYGAKDILSVALILGVAKGLSVIMTEGLIIDTVLHYGEMLLSNISGVIFPAIAYILYIPMSLLIPSSSGLHTATIPILAPLGDFLNVGREFIVMACQAGSETMNFISPTQAVLIGALTLANVPYERWLKHILPFFFGIIAITCSVLTVGCIFF